MTETQKTELKGLVKEAFKNALENGYEDFMYGGTPYDVAEDLADNDQAVGDFMDLHEIDISELEDLVEEVQKEKT